MIVFNNVTKIYDNNVVALDDVTFFVDKGEFVFMVGQSGAGKSSVIKLLLCEELPTSGQVFFNNVDINTLKHKEIPFHRRRLGVVFQDFRLLPKKTVYENVAFAMQIVGASSRRMRREIPEILSMVGLTHKAKMLPGELSGGEQQRVSIARALINKPDILIADEPTGNLDVETAGEIMQLIDTINKNGTTVIMATHAQQIVNDMRKRVITLDKGLIFSDQEEGGYQIGVKEL